MKQFEKLIVTLIGTFGTAIASKYIMSGGPDATWYQNLTKPVFNPPPYVFMTIWPLLFMLMTLATWRIWQKKETINWSVSFYFLHLPLQLLWAYLFWVEHNLMVALALIAITTTCSFVIAHSYKKIDMFAYLLFISYPIWMTFATVLNWRLFILNG